MSKEDTKYYIQASLNDSSEKLINLVLNSFAEMRKELDVNLDKISSNLVQEFAGLEAYVEDSIDEIYCEEEEDEEVIMLDFPSDLIISTGQMRSLVKHTPYDKNIGNNRWMCETFNGCYLSPNAWGFGGNAGGTSDLEIAYVTIKINNNNQLVFNWEVGGYKTNFNGYPQHSWFSKFKGGNDVKAYPRIGIGSASGQEVATSGAPYNVPCKITNGWKHVDQLKVYNNYGLPIELEYLTFLKVDLDFEMNSNGLTEKLDGEDMFGNCIIAIDSYLHDLSDDRLPVQTNSEEKINLITDSSGSIFGQKMSELKKTTKDWAVMVWLSRPPYYETSGGRKIGEFDYLGDIYDINFKIETAGGKSFKYISFVSRRRITELQKFSEEFDMTYFYNFMQSNAFQDMLDEQEVVFDGKKVVKPGPQHVLSDINFGVETLCNNEKIAGKIIPAGIKINKVIFKTDAGDFGFVKKLN